MTERASTQAALAHAPMPKP